MARIQRVGMLWFFENQDGNATSNYLSWPGGRGQFAASGGFNGATVQLERRGVEPGKELIIGPDTSLTTDSVGNFECPPCELRASITGGTSPQGLYVQAYRIPQPT